MASEFSDPRFVSQTVVLSFLLAASFFVLLYSWRNPRRTYRLEDDENYLIIFSVVMGCIIFILVLCLSLVIRQKVKSNGE